nr:uncharacterized protein LOC125984099 isoform X7 [Syngnathus scovelli]
MCVEGWFRSFQLILQEPHGRQVSPFGHLQVESPFVAVRTAMIEWSKLQPRSGSDTQTAWRKPFLCEDLSLPSQSAERHEPVDTMGNAEFKESRPVLVGNTGSGKSSSGNTILGKFLAKLSGSSVTRECQSDSTDRSFDDDQKRMRNYTVVDMPGFGDTRLTEEEILCEDMSLPSQSAERHQPVDMMGIAELEEIRLVLVGNTGSGKSSSANTILGQKKFLAKLSGSSVTRKCQSGSTDRAFDDEQKRMRKITVVDIPGFGDTHLTEEEIHTEMAKCLYLTAPGPHAFLLVVPIGRYTDYEAQAVNHLAKIFGDDAVKSHTIVLFTKGDSLEGMEFDEYLEESPDGLRELIDKCGGRYHVFNNKENYGNATQVQELMMKVDKMGKKSETEFYTNAMFKEAEAAIRKEQKRKQEMELETDNEESKPVSQSIRKRKLPQRQDQKSERKGCNGASTQKVAPSSKLMANLKRIVAAGAVGLAIGVAFGVAVPLTAALSAHLAGSAVGLVAAQLTGASAAGAVSAVVAAASGKTALAIGAAAGGLIGAGIGVIAGSEAESVKEGALDSLVQVSSVGGVALAASVVVGASLGTAAALSAGTGAAAANSGLAPLAAQNGPTSGGTLVAGPGTTSCAATGAEGVQDTVQVAPVAAAARNTALDAVVAFGKVAAAVIPTGVVVKVVVDKTKDSQKSTYEVSFNK